MEIVTHLSKLPPRPADGHKGMFGRVLVVGGSEGMIGAPVMAGTAALRGGAGLVQIAVPKTILSAAISITPELIGMGLGKSAAKEKLLDAANKADAVVIGPGLGQSALTEGRVLRVIRLTKPMVIDADALNILSAQKRWPAYFKATAVLTPHPGEMARLGKLFDQTEVPKDPDGRISIAIKAAMAFGQIIVLKGSGTVVTDGTRVYVNPTGDSSLSKAGTGDCLSGLLGEFLAGGMDRFDAACAATWIHGRAGELAGRRVGMRCVLAKEVIDHMPDAIAEYEKANS